MSAATAAQSVPARLAVAPAALQIFERVVGPQAEILIGEQTQFVPVSFSREAM